MSAHSKVAEVRAWIERDTCCDDMVPTDSAALERRLRGRRQLADLYPGAHGWRSPSVAGFANDHLGLRVWGAAHAYTDAFGKRRSSSEGRVIAAAERKFRTP